MFSRSLPRAAPRVARVAQCAARPQVAACTKRPAPALHPVQQQLGRRHASSMRDQFRTQFRRSPIMFPLAIGIIVIAGGICVLYIPWYYRNVITKPYHNFPESVAKKLRRALFYSRGDYLDIKEANKYFRQALQLATQEGMDPFSDEIMGVKYTIAQLFQDAGYYALACDVLEIMRTDCQRWVDEFSDKHWNNGNRSRVKKNMVQINVKLAQLYDSKYVNEPHNAEKRLVEAVESALLEKQRRKDEGEKPGEGSWLSDEEMGATLEALGQHYEENNSHYLATPLFLQALTLCPPQSCHAVVLMNNISTCLAQQTPPPPPPQSTTASPSPQTSSNTEIPTSAPPPRTVLLDQARQWAQKALAHAAQIKPPNRDEECDVGCAVATHNLGEFFEMEDRVAEARQKYQEAASLAKAMGFREGKANARAGLKRLEGRT